ncbi:cyclic nucleotide-binding domain-containing protein [Solirubrobacter sp. CPCC 204708]|uniref:Cyclic nucleotide-binding domain-containing protein n=1 Tax=Solirubrobacter deserti TaxID=2282478 RepID=A0ABT4REC5_9ACTN|nr:cyclic nucleotide-binding domain-containing protein [Solirubrobacter deserti]MBE2316141.1 cyclic nucleotide-binding domain-containing protein [Solirubrobacter deserti]MDA0136891.1 cyclic nucleotide-binding domain-containing protein [Solirubrobacter deserti]
MRIVPFVPGRRPTDEARSAGQGSSDPVAFLNAGPGNRCLLLLELDGDGEGEVTTLTGNHIRRRAFTPERVGERAVLALDPDTDCAGDYGFAHRFMQTVQVSVRFGGEEAATTIDVFDLSQLGSLYQRIVEQVVKPDVERQAPWLSYKTHPWYPVLLIGSHKAELYTRALVGDVVRKRQNLADPGWLTRVGLYLELMTALGVIAAVRDDPGDLLSPEERAAADTWDDLTINVDGWREVAKLRKVAQPIGLRNLLAKKKATLEFLHVHHEDLKHAIELAGPNRTNAQETWHRVFRDAERAVLCKTPEAFPELGLLPDELREFILWHRRGHVRMLRALRVPGPLPKLVGDQDGLFASACNQYRASMNDVAEWAAERGLMEHAGGECVPRQVSLLEAHMNQPSRVALLQARDGYDPERGLEVGEDLPPDYTPPLRDVAALLGAAPIFAPLTPEELDTLAHTARPLTFGPAERILVQDEPGDSLFVVVEGTVEVFLRRHDGEEVDLGTRSQGAVLGEMSLLTGAPRSATVRALDGALVYEVGRKQYEPILEARPVLRQMLEDEMQTRLQAQAETLSGSSRSRRRSALRGRRPRP